MKKYLLSALIGVSALTLVGGSVAYAQSDNGNGANMLETKAEVFGMTVDELEIAHETMDFEEIALQQGVSIDEMHAQMEAKAVARWSERGLSDEEISERLAVRSEQNIAGEGPHSGGLGFGQGGNGSMEKGSGSGMNGDGECDLSSN